MNHAVHTSNCRRKPQAAVVVGIICRLNDQLRLAVYGKEIYRVPYERPIAARVPGLYFCAVHFPHGAHLTRSAQILAVNKNTGGAKGLLKVQSRHARPLYAEPISGRAIEISVCME